MSWRWIHPQCTDAEMPHPQTKVVLIADLMAHREAWAAGCV